jgi:hypothetical protein
MVGNFRAREISRDARKLVRTPTLIKKTRTAISCTGHDGIVDRPGV